MHSRGALADVRAIKLLVPEEQRIRRCGATRRNVSGIVGDLGRTCIYSKAIRQCGVAFRSAAMSTDIRMRGVCSAFGYEREVRPV